MRRPTTLLAASALLAAATLASATPSTAGPPPALSLTVDPATGLVDGDIVEVGFDGYDSWTPFFLWQCRAGAMGRADCAEAPLYESLVGLPGPQSGVVGVWAVIRLPAGSTVDCRLEACSVMMEQNGFTSSVEVPVSFDPAGPLLEPVVHAAPTTGLHDGDIVVVTLSQFRPFTNAYFDQCEIGVDSHGCSPRLSRGWDNLGGATSLLASTAAVAEAGVGLTLNFRVGDVMETEDFRIVDCRPANCELRVRQDPDVHEFAFPLVFATETAPPARPTPSPVSGAPGFTG